MIDDNFMLCVDCYSVEVGGDATRLDYYYSPEDADNRLKEINEAAGAVKGQICCGDSSMDEEFSDRSCDLCRSTEAGSRHHCVILAG